MPSSTHEVLLLAYWEGVEFGDLRRIIRNVNEAMAGGEDILSNHVYLYKQKDGEVYIAM